MVETIKDPWYPAMWPLWTTDLRQQKALSEVRGRFCGSSTRCPRNSLGPYADSRADPASYGLS